VAADVADRGPGGAEDAAGARHEDGLDRELLGERAGVQRSRPAEGHEREVPRNQAPPDLDPEKGHQGTSRMFLQNLGSKGYLVPAWWWGGWGWGNNVGTDSSFLQWYADWYQWEGEYVDGTWFYGGSPIGREAVVSADATPEDAAVDAPEPA